MSSSLIVNSHLNRHHWQPSLTNSTIREEEPQNKVYPGLGALTEESVEDEEDEPDEPDDSSTFTSSPSIPDENIDFDLVYTLHTFEATVEGQASVLKGDYLALLDDTNSYWWLIRVLKSNQVGYIPAEHIETPFERLARLNKHRNIGITAHTLDNTLSPSCSIKKRLNVTMAKGILYQSHTILLGDGDEELEDVYEEWEDVMVDQDSQATLSGVVTREDLSLVDNDDNDDERFLQDQNSTIDQNTPEPLVAIPQSLMHSTISTTLPLLTISEPILYSPPDKEIKKPVGGPLFRLFSRGKRLTGKIGTTKGITLPPLSNQVSHLDRSPPPPPRSSSLSINSIPIFSPVSSILDPLATIIRVYAGNINVNATYNSVLVYDYTKADDLLQQAMDRFHISQIEGKAQGSSSSQRPLSSSSSSHSSDELILRPQDKPLMIHQSLTGHLTTPMPALATRQIGSPATLRRTSPEDIVRFYLHKRIKRVNEQDGKLVVKVSLYHQEDVQNKNNNSTLSFRHTSSFSLLRKIPIPDPPAVQSRIDKLIAISSNATVADLIDVALEKFHLSQQTDYTITLTTNNQERQLDPKCKLIEISTDHTTDKQFVLQKSLCPNEPLLTPIPVMQLDTDTEMVLRRLERVLATHYRKPNDTAAVPARLCLDPHQPKLAVMRNINQGVDVYLPHGILRSKPVGTDQTHYTLLAHRENNTQWELVVQRTLPPTVDDLDVDLETLGRFGTRVLKSGFVANTVDLSSLDELEYELQRIMASLS